MSELSDVEKDVCACAEMWLHQSTGHSGEQFSMPVEIAQKVFASLITMRARLNGVIVPIFPHDREPPLDFIARRRLEIAARLVEAA